MLRRLINKDNLELNKDNKGYTSWYDLSKKEACNLEKEFTSKDMGKVANNAMHICVIIGIFTFVLCSFILEFFILSGYVTPYNFTVMIILILLGTFIVVGATIEYHTKFNSWLKVKHRIIKK